MSPDFELRTIHRVLVTGASGFIGSHLVKYFAEQSVPVSGLVRKLPDNHPILTDVGRSADVNLIPGDITRPETLTNAVRKADTVFHVAAVLGPAHLPLSRYQEINAGGTRNIIEACKTSGNVERFVHVSSTGAIGPVPPRTHACEGTPPRPQDKYEITKLEGEEIALASNSTGFPTVIARPAWVYGPGDMRTLKLFRMIAKGRFLIIGKGRNKQHPVWIGDLIQGLIRCALVNGIEGRVYHLGGPEILTIEELCRSVAQATGSRILPLRPPLWMAEIPGFIMEKIYSLVGKEPPIDRRKVNFFKVNRAYSIERAKNELGWEPAIDFEEGIQRTIAWYRQMKLI